VDAYCRTYVELNAKGNSSAHHGDAAAMKRCYGNWESVRTELLRKAFFFVKFAEARRSL